MNSTGPRLNRRPPARPPAERPAPHHVADVRNSPAPTNERPATSAIIQPYFPRRPWRHGPDPIGAGGRLHRANQRADHTHIDVPAPVSDDRSSAARNHRRLSGFPTTICVTFRSRATVNNAPPHHPRLRNHFRAEPAGQPERPRQHLLLLRGESARRSTQTTIHGQSSRVAARRVQRIRLSAYGLGPTPTISRAFVFHGTADPAGAADVLEIAIHALGGEAQRQFAERGQIALLEKTLRRCLARFPRDRLSPRPGVRAACPR